MKGFGFGRARNETSAKKWKRGEGEPIFRTVLTLTPCSLLLNRTKTLATQATSVHPLFFVVTYRWRCSWLSSQAAHSKYPWRELVIFPTFLCKMSESVPWAPLRICFFYGLIFPLSIPAEGIFNVQRGNYAKSNTIGRSPRRRAGARKR